jgi:hypothetical protein
MQVYCAAFQNASHLNAALLRQAMLFKMAVIILHLVMLFKMPAI